MLEWLAIAAAVALPAVLLGIAGRVVLRGMGVLPTPPVPTYEERVAADNTAGVRAARALMDTGVAGGNQAQWDIAPAQGTPAMTGGANEIRTDER